MKKAYLLVYSGTMGDRDKIKNVLDNLYMINTWRYDLPNCFYLISEYSAKQISEEIRERCSNNGRFIVSEIPTNSYGWLSDGSWHLIQNKVHKPK